MNTEAAPISLSTIDEIRAAARKGGARPTELLQALGRLFPSLQHQFWTQPGFVMSIDHISKVLKSAGASHQMCYHTAAFCLGVYNYNKNKFDFINAVEMNPADRAVILSWAADPFWF